MSWGNLTRRGVVGLAFMIVGFILFGFVVFSNTSYSYSCTVSNFACKYTNFTVTCTPKHESLIKSLGDIGTKLVSFVAGTFLSLGSSILFEDIQNKKINSVDNDN